MIARLAALLRRTDELTAARAEIRQLHKDLANEQAHCNKQVTRIAELEKQLSDERFITARLGADVDRQEKTAKTRDSQLALQREVIAAMQRDAKWAEPRPCECGGDAELHWRRRAAAAEAQARQDRVNAVAMADELERLLLVVEQLESAGIVRTA